MFVDGVIDCIYSYYIGPIISYVQSSAMSVSAGQLRPNSCAIIVERPPGKNGDSHRKYEIFCLGLFSLLSKDVYERTEYNLQRFTRVGYPSTGS